MKAKIRILTWLFRLVRWYLISKTVHHMTMLDGQKLYREKGKVVGGVIRKDASGLPVDMEMFLARPGYSPTDMTRFSVLSLVREPNLGWAFYD